MLRRPLMFSFLSSVAVLLTMLAKTTAHAQVIFVAGGDCAGLGAAIAALPPGGTVVIEPSGIFTLCPVALGAADSGTKIMAAPGIVAAFDGTGTPAGSNAFTIAGATNVILENLKITAWPGAGVLVAEASSVKIINCQITQSVPGVFVAGVLEVSGSRILNNTTGVMVLGAGAPPGGSATIERTEIRNNSEFGLLVLGVGGRVKVWHSVIDMNGLDGVHVTPLNVVVLNNNDISFNGAIGVFYAPGAMGSVSFNTIAFNTGAGIAFVPAPVITVAPGNNTVAGNTPNVAPPGVLLPPNQVGP